MQPELENDMNPSIRKIGERVFELNNLQKNESIWLDLAPFSLYINLTDEGLVVDIHPISDDGDTTSVASTYAFADDVLPDDEDDH
jgi:hypothetical protein